MTCPWTGREDSWSWEPKGRAGTNVDGSRAGSGKMRAENIPARGREGPGQEGQLPRQAGGPPRCSHAGPERARWPGPKTKPDVEIFTEPGQLSGESSTEEKWFGSRNEQKARRHPPHPPPYQDVMGKHPPAGSCRGGVSGTVRL